MSPLTRLPLMLAQSEPADPAPALQRFSQISETFSSKELISPHGLFIAAGAVLLLLSCLSIAHWYRHRHERARPLRVFAGAARLAGLGFADQWTLFWIARSQSLSTPLSLLLSPGTFDHHVKAYLVSRSNWRREALRKRAQTIRECLFGDLPTRKAPDPSSD